MNKRKSVAVAAVMGLLIVAFASPMGAAEAAESTDAAEHPDLAVTSSHCDVKVDKGVYVCVDTETVDLAVTSSHCDVKVDKGVYVCVDTETVDLAVTSSHCDVKVDKGVYVCVDTETFDLPV